jgi:uncharacterized protein (DUF1778 family)
MASSTIQISANISRQTKRLLDAYVRRRGIKKSFVVEEALRHHLAALNEIPEDYLIPPVVRVSAAGMRAMAELLESPPSPTPALQRLMSER